MRGRIRNRERSVALVLAVAILAVLAVVGFSFASTARMERAATSAIRDTARARLAAQAALLAFPGVLLKDAMYQPGLSIGGPTADHPGETGLFGASMGSDGEIQTVGNTSVLAEMGTVRDEASKMNLNAFGNISKWYAANRPAPKTDADAGTISDPNRGLYHGANHRFSSFEVSFEEFFYHQRSMLWSGQSDAVCRIRSARLAMAICLYRYGNDGWPGGPGDDDDDNELLSQDKLDNDGDGLIDELNEGINEPDEYNPLDPDGDGDVNTSNGPLGDRRFESIADFKTAIATVNLDGTGVAVGYASDAAAEAERIFQLVRSNLTVHSYTHDARAICIDDLRTDKYDNDGDGKIDAHDATGVATLQDILNLVPPGGNIRDLNPFAIDIKESAIDNQAQAVLLWLKLRYGVRYLQEDGVTYNTDPTPLVAGMRETATVDPGIERGLKHALNIVDYRDADCVPTMIPKDAFGANDPPRNVYGMEALHVTEIGRFVDMGSFALTADGDPWTGSGTCTYTWNDATDHTSALKITDTTANVADRKLHLGSYLIKVTLTVPRGSLTLRARDNTEKTYDASGTYYFGPFTAVAEGSNSVGQIIAIAAGGQNNDVYEVKNIKVYLPYIEVMNWSRQPKNMGELKVLVGPGSGGNATALSGIRQAVGADPNSALVRGHTRRDSGFEGGANKRGVNYGVFVIVYDEEAFDNYFADGNRNGRWGANDPTPNTDEDFPICVMPQVFQNGFDGTQRVTLWKGSDLVAGGMIDFRTDTGSGTTFSTTALAMCRGYLGGDMSYSASGGSACAPFVSETTGTSTLVYATSPGRYDRHGTSTETNSFLYAYWWPNLTNFESSATDARPFRLADCILVGDRGYFRSPAEVLCLSIPEKSSQTFSFETRWEPSPDGTGEQPRLREFLVYLVASRAPARVNVNTAPLPVLAAAFCPIEPDTTGYLESGVTLPTASNIESDRGSTYYNNPRDMGAKTLFANAYMTPTADNDGANDGNDNNERQEWLIRNANVFTLRSNVFSATVTGVVRNAAGRTLAKCSLAAMYDRGAELDADWRPKVKLLSVAPGD